MSQHVKNEWKKLEYELQLKIAVPIFNGFDQIILFQYLPVENPLLSKG